MTVKNPERENQSPLQWKCTGFIPKAFQKSRAKASFVICTRVLNLSGPTEGKLLTTALPTPACGWETWSQRQRLRRDTSEISTLHEHVPGMERGGRKGGRKAAGWMHRYQNPLGRRQIKRQKLEQHKCKRHGWSSCCSSPPPQEGEARACSHLPLPSPESCGLEQPPSFRERRDESRGLQGNPSPQRTWAGLQCFIFKINLALLSVGFRGIKGRSSCSCLVFWQVQDIFNFFWVKWTWLLKIF